MRAESTAQTAIPSIPPSIIEPFLTRPLVIEPDGLDNAPTIVAAEESRVILENGQPRLCAGHRRFQGIDLVRLPARRPAGRSGQQDDAGLRGDLSWDRARDPRRRARCHPALLGHPGSQRRRQARGRGQAGNTDLRAARAVEPVQGRIISLYGRDSRLGEYGNQTVIAINLGKVAGHRGRTRGRPRTAGRDRRRCIAIQDRLQRARLRCPTSATASRSCFAYSTGYPMHWS